MLIIILVDACRYIFKRLRFLGNRQVSWAITMAFVSLWHGVWPGYYINFSLEMLLVMAERTVSPVMQSLCFDVDHSAGSHR